ncbi:MAG TPA: aminoglycoside phosphotransferase family protein, partial [Candidatus Acetothermia bacterium]|nr:aminoglycoside phosphotransferase family protein [Candidatus Acetothermia bacterium]
GRLPEEAVRAATERLRGLPEGDRICHGDFHPDNVLMTSRGPMIIDWGPATAGHPAADVAWTILLFRYAGVPPGTPRGIRALLAALRRLMLRTYLRTYARCGGLSRKEIQPWLLPVAILRLGDGIVEERDALQALIGRELRRGRASAAVSLR